MVSLAIGSELQCNRCCQAHEAQVWLLVDSSERPDLVERIRQRTLRQSVCSHCGHVNELSVSPLLVYRPDKEPKLLFAPASRDLTPAEEQAVVWLGQELADRLGAVWRDEWAYDMGVVPFKLLPVLLDDECHEHLLELLSEFVRLS